MPKLLLLYNFWSDTKVLKHFFLSFSSFNTVSWGVTTALTIITFKRLYFHSFFLIQSISWGTLFSHIRGLFTDLIPQLISSGVIHKGHI